MFLLQPYLGEEPGVIDKHTVHALLQGMEEADLLSVHIDDDARVPTISILIVPEGAR